MSNKWFNGLLILAILAGLIDLGHTFHLGYHKHMVFETPEVWINFYGFFGLAAALLVVMGAMILRAMIGTRDGGDV